MSLDYKIWGRARAQNRVWDHAWCQVWNRVSILTRAQIQTRHRVRVGFDQTWAEINQ